MGGGIGVMELVENDPNSWHQAKDTWQVQQKKKEEDTTTFRYNALWQYINA